jgi:hypothetical protein
LQADFAVKGSAAINPRTILRPATYYLKKGLVFFDLKAKIIPPAVFVITFGLSFACYFIQGMFQGGGADGAAGSAGSAGSIGASGVISGASDAIAGAPAIPMPQLLIQAALLLACSAILNIASSVYLRAAIMDARNESCSVWDNVRSVLKNAGRLVAAAMLKNLAVFAGLLLFVVPGIVIALEYLFAECAIVDAGIGVRESFNRSRRIMRGRKMPVFQVLLFCNLVLLIFMSLFLQMFAGSNNAVFAYASMFLFSIYSLMLSKMTAFMYFDMAYAKAERPS